MPAWVFEHHIYLRKFWNCMVLLTHIQDGNCSTTTRVSECNMFILFFALLVWSKFSVIWCWTIWWHQERSLSFGYPFERRLATNYRLLKFNIEVDHLCVFCNAENENIDYFLFDCVMTKNVWEDFLRWLKFGIAPISFPYHLKPKKHIYDTCWWGS